MRLVDAFAHRLTLQETIGEEVAGALVEHLKPRWAACRLTMSHACMCARGERRHGARVESVALHGTHERRRSRARVSRARGRRREPGRRRDGSRARHRARRGAAPRRARVRRRAPRADGGGARVGRRRRWWGWVGARSRSGATWPTRARWRARPSRFTAELGVPRVVVANAGVVRRALVVETSEEDWDHVIDVNLKGAFLTARALLPAMIHAKRGRFVAVASISATLGTPRHARLLRGEVGHRRLREGTRRGAPWPRSSRR